MSNRPGSGVPANAKHVLAYFLRNPQAADTLEGVVRWRLLEERIQRSVDDVNEALAWLVSERFLLKDSPEGSDAIFRLNREKVHDAKDFLTNESGPNARSKRRK